MSCLVNGEWRVSCGDDYLMRLALIYFMMSSPYRDVRKPPVGWSYRKLLELEDAELDQEIDDRPAFLVRKGNVSFFPKDNDVRIKISSYLFLTTTGTIFFGCT